MKYLESIQAVGPDKHNILLMDSHNSHTFNFQFIQLINKNNIEVLALPSHTTHCLQPLDDDAPFTNFKNFWYEGIDDYVKKVGPKSLAKTEFFQFFSPAWRRAVIVNKTKADFNNTGI